MNLLLSEISKKLGYEYIGGDVTIYGVSIDTRTINKGELFFAISGENFDGHDYLNIAMDAGAAAVVIEKPSIGDYPVLKVSSVRRALAELSAYWRKRFDLPVVAITGSNGKTTVKEMLSSIFSQRGDTLSTKGNLNNDLGVPLTLMRLEDDHKFAVIEIGANHLEEISQIVQWVKPSVCIVTMIGDSHLEGFGSIENIVKAKSEIFQGLAVGGTAIINRDDDFYEDLARAADAYEIITFGFSGEADIKGCIIKGVLNVSAMGLQVEIEMSLLGVHNYKNALAAVAAALASGMGMEDIQHGLKAMEAVSGRLKICRDVEKYNVIDDSYNANPESVKAAIDVLVDQGECCCLVLGDMKELGNNEHSFHKDIGYYARKKGVTYVFCKGDLVKSTAEAFGAGGYYNNDFKSILERFEAVVPAGCNVLVKGSRSTKMERFIKLLGNKLHDTEISGGIIA